MCKNSWIRRAVIGAAAIGGARSCLVVGFFTLSGSGIPNIDPFFRADFLRLILSVALATFAVGFAFWSWCMPIRTSARLGALAGTLAGVVSHPAAWALFFLSDVVTKPQNGLILIQNVNLIPSVISTSIFFSYWSLLIAGIFTVSATSLAGAIVGALLSEKLNTGDSA